MHQTLTERLLSRIDISKLRGGDFRQLARAITLVENDYAGGRELLMELPFDVSVPVIGLTGPPGAGKSSLVNALIHHLLSRGMKIGIVAVDPTSPFNFGSLLGDRIRMAEHFNDENVYIRSLATRGSLGGLSARIYEVTDVMKHAGFDVILIETVGVGQSEVEIAGIADTTAVVLVPEAGDEIQTLKSGLMEIADVFIVNKSDREGADHFVRNLSALARQKMSQEWIIPVVKTVATEMKGVPELWDALKAHQAANLMNERRNQLMLEKAMHLVLTDRMKGIDKHKLKTELETKNTLPGFNLYQFLNNNYFNGNHS